MKKLTLIDTVTIDAGHGGLLNGQYTTAPSKMYKHKDDTVAYEGVINRKIAEYADTYLQILGWNTCYTVAPTDPTDLSLDRRVYTGNLAPERSLFWSIHNNATRNHNASGSVMFAYNSGDSGIVADLMGRSFSAAYPSIYFFKDRSTGAYYRKANFKVLRETEGLAVLSETLFFDSYKDWQLLQNEDFLLSVAYVYASAIDNALRIVNLKRRVAFGQLDFNA